MDAAFWFIILWFLRHSIAHPIIGQSCNNGSGECRPIGDCDSEAEKEESPDYCNEDELIVCCPIFVDPMTNVTSRSQLACEEFSKIRDVCREKEIIVNGTLVQPREYPFMALVGARYTENSLPRWTCGGTIIHPKYVLTAGHCLDVEYNVTDKSTPYLVRLGELDFNSTLDDAYVQNRAVIDYFTHDEYEDFANGAVIFDIALLLLDSEIIFNAYVKPACLPTAEVIEQPKLTIAGWGISWNKRPVYVSQLYKVDLDLLPLEHCKTSKKEWNKTQICAGQVTGLGDACQGDSGGPLFLSHESHISCLSVVHGITSYGKSCNTKPSASIYTRVYSFVNWIEDRVWPES